MFTVEIQNDNGYTIDEARLQAAARVVLSQHNADPAASLTVVVTNDESVAVLNRQYRGVDSATDVLSFPADAPPVAVDGEPPYLGDLIIAYPYAAAQAARAGHDLQDNLMLLVVHGTLHLLGYDHDTPSNRADMWAAQEAALVALQISPQIIPALESSGHDH
jgi:probable rRNA maturation factor